LTQLGKVAALAAVALLSAAPGHGQASLSSTAAAETFKYRVGLGPAYDFDR
jgi:hypothetical protein